MSWFGSEVKDSAEGIGNGISTATQGIRSMFTGDVPPDIAVKLLEIEVEANKLTTQRWVADTNSGGFASIIRPAVFLLLVLVYVTLVLVDGLTSFSVSQPTMDSIQALLFLIIPTYYGLRSLEKFKGITK